MKKITKHQWITVGVAVVCAVVFFFVGAAYGKGSASSAAGRGAFGSSTRAAFAGRGTAGGGGFVSGQIVSVDSSSLTVSLANGNSENVYYSSSTFIVKPTPGSASDLQTGAMVMIGGTTNSDGSVTASTIQIRNGSSTTGFGR